METARGRTWLLAAAILLLSVCQGATLAAPACCKPDDANCLKAYDGNRVALIVGVDDYGSPNEAVDRLTDLKNAVNDAESIAQILSLNSYKVRCLANPTANDFFKEIDRLKAHLSGIPAAEKFDSSVLIHFSGHGFQVDQQDYIFLSGSFKSLEDAKASGVRVFEFVTTDLNKFADLNLLLIVDACRNISNKVPKWMAQPGLRTDATPHTIIYSAQPGELAHDKNADIKAEKNGAFVFTLKKYFRLQSFQLIQVYHAVGDDPGMMKIKQLPAFRSSAHTFPPRSWAGPSDSCASSESFAAQSALRCQRLGGDIRSCVLSNACPDVELLEQAKRGGKFCTRDALVAVFPDVAACTAKNLPVANMLPIIPGADNVFAAAPDLPQLRREAILTSAPQRIQDKPIARVSLPQPSSQPGGTMGDLIAQVGRLEQTALTVGQPARLDQVVPLRNKIFLTASSKKRHKSSI